MTLSAYTDRRPWWADAAFYQIYPRSYADGNGDGIGDLIGVRKHLDHLVALGIEAVWFSPFYRSPMADGGYDVADPCDIDPMFGTLEDFDALLADAHDRGIRVTIDMVPNHFSSEHPWFQAVLAGGKHAAERALFIIRPGRGPNGDQPPNNWPSVFGGPAWSRLPDGDWYLHLFAPEQPDLNWDNPAVPAEFERIMRFWLDRGVDGFRIDVAHGMAKPPGLPDLDLSVLPGPDEPGTMPDERDIRWDQDGVHEYHRLFRRVLDSYPGDRMAVGEAWVADPRRLALYVRPDELNLTFNFELVEAKWGEFRPAIERSLAALAEVGAPCTWVLDNHDVDRTATRYGGGEVGVARARAAALIQLSLPGAAFVYNGDELGLTNVELPDEVLQDPTWERSGHTQRGRDAERVPLPWSGDAPPYGFGPGTGQPWLPQPLDWEDRTVAAQVQDPTWERSGHTQRGRDAERVPLPWSGDAPPFGFTEGSATWLPMPESWAALTVQAQDGDPASTLNLYRTTLRLRRELADLRQPELQWLDAPEGCLAYRRGGLSVWLNAGDGPVPLPAGELVHASGPVADGQLPPDTAVWVRG